MNYQRDLILIWENYVQNLRYSNSDLYIVLIIIPVYFLLFYTFVMIIENEPPKKCCHDDDVRHSFDNFPHMFNSF